MGPRRLCRRGGEGACPPRERIRGLWLVGASLVLWACQGDPAPAAPSAAAAPAEAEGRAPQEAAESPAEPATTGAQAEGNAPEGASPEDPDEAAEKGVETFDQVEVGALLPQGWSAPVGKWRVEAKEGDGEASRVLMQRASNRSPVFNLALSGEASHGDVDVRVRLRALKGRIDQGGGVVWRAADARNYYIARYNPLEDNYRVYTVEQGRRRQLASAEVKLDHAAWHTLRVTMTGDHLACFLDGQKHLDVRDDTFTAPGRVGLWTKADAQTQFDDFAVRALAAEPPASTQE